MLVVMDVGNSRTKWAPVNADGSLQQVNAFANTELNPSSLKRALKGVSKIVISNVAGEAMAEKLREGIPARTQVFFVSAQPQSAGVINRYQESQTLGSDRWAAMIAAWKLNKQPTVVVNAGTAITIDGLARDSGSKNGVFIGGTIMPGLRLMREALMQNTAQLKSLPEGKSAIFPTNTQDAIHTGCMNAVVGAINVMSQSVEKHCAYLPKLVISGGDANKIAEVIKPQLKRVIIAEHLVLQGLVLLEKEYV